MAIAQMPDVVGAMVAHLLAQTGLANEVSNRIAPEHKNAWGNLKDAAGKKTIVITQAPSSSGGAPELGIVSTTLDCRCYGPDRRSTLEVWRWLHPTIFPDQSSGQKCSFTRFNCRVYYTQWSGGPTTDQENGDGWWVTIASYDVTWSILPATPNTEGTP